MPTENAPSKLTMATDIYALCTSVEEPGGGKTEIINMCS
jgi:hypothetical protein